MPVNDDFNHEEIDVMQRVSGLPIDELGLAVASNVWRVRPAF